MVSNSLDGAFREASKPKWVIVDSSGHIYSDAPGTNERSKETFQKGGNLVSMFAYLRHLASETGISNRLQDHYRESGSFT
jgi:hypothetical protein